MQPNTSSISPQSLPTYAVAELPVSQVHAAATNSSAATSKTPPPKLLEKKSEENSSTEVLEWKKRSATTKTRAASIGTTTTTATTTTTTTTTTATTTTTTPNISNVSNVSNRGEPATLRVLRAARENSLSALLKENPGILETMSTTARQIMLVSAAHQGSQQLVGVLLAMKDIDVNGAIAGGSTALHAACEQGNAGMATLLLKAGSQPSAMDGRSMTPLALAARSGNLETVKLIAPTLNPYTLADTDAYGRSALLHAANGGHTQVVHYLLKSCKRTDARADVKAMLSAAAHNLPMAIITLHQAGISIEVSNENGITPLKAAAYRNHVGAIHTLLTLGAKLSHEGVVALNALESAICVFESTSKSRSTGTIIALIEGYNKPIPIRRIVYNRLRMIVEAKQDPRLKLAFDAAYFEDENGRRCN